MTVAAWAFLIATGALVAALVRLGPQAHRRHAMVADAERRARLGGEHARRQLAFLAAASEMLARSIDEPVPMLQGLLGILVPEFADLGAVDLVADGVLTRVATSPDIAAGDGQDLIDRVLATGEPVLVKDVNATGGGDCIVADDVVSRFAEELGLASAMVVPMRVRGLSIGALTVGTRPGRRGFRPSDLAAAEDLASRMSIAIERSLLFAESESRAAEATARASQMASVALENARLYDRAAEDERHLQALLDATPVALVEIDAEGRSTRWNPAALRLFGWDADTQAPALPSTVAEVCAPSRLGRRVVEEPVTLAGADRDLALMVSSVPLHPVDGRSSALVVVSDLTERREVERQLGQAQRLEAMARVAGAVAHDFNNLLTIVVGYSELLLRHRRADDLAEPLEAIRRAGSRASELTLQLLTISRRDVVERAAVDVDELIDELEPVLGRIAGEAVKLVLDLGTGGARVLGDRGQLEQVVLNLVMNARDAMPAGGIITIETSLVGEGEQPRLRLVVHDTGAGMDEETSAHCFEPFFTTKPRTKGTGLGLSTAHATIAQAGGAMTVHSRLGSGTTFQCELPVTALEPTVEAATGADPLASSGRVLLIEDDDDVRNLVDDVLQLTGYEVRAFAEAAAALEAIDECRPDVVVTDVVMPGMDGMELARRLRARCPDLPILVISGYADAAPAPVDDLTTFLAKPFTEATLTAAVRAAMTSRVGPRSNPDDRAHRSADHEVGDQEGSKR